MDRSSQQGRHLISSDRAVDSRRILERVLDLQLEIIDAHEAVVDKVPAKVDVCARDLWAIVSERARLLVAFNLGSMF